MVKAFIWIALRKDFSDPAGNFGRVFETHSERSGFFFSFLFFNGLSGRGLIEIYNVLNVFPTFFFSFSK